MRAIRWLHVLLVRLDLLKAETLADKTRHTSPAAVVIELPPEAAPAVVAPVKAAQQQPKPRAPRKPAAPKVPKVKAPKPAPAVDHALAVKRELLNLVADALGNAPVEPDAEKPKVTIAANGSTYTIRNTVGALTEFQTRLEKLQTAIKVPGVPLAARSFKVHAPTLEKKTP